MFKQIGIGTWYTNLVVVKLFSTHRALLEDCDGLAGPLYVDGMVEPPHGEALNWLRRRQVCSSAMKLSNITISICLRS
jgi:hypothetical protein